MQVYPLSRRGGKKQKKRDAVIQPVPFITGGVDTKDLSSRISTSLKDSLTDYQIKDMREEDRSIIAKQFVKYLLRLVVLVIIGVPIYNALVFKHAKVVIEDQATVQPLSLDGTLTDVGTILGPSVGFVVGYYFKDEVKRRVAKELKARKEDQSD